MNKISKKDFATLRKIAKKMLAEQVESGFETGGADLLRLINELEVQNEELRRAKQESLQAVEISKALNRIQETLHSTLDLDRIMQKLVDEGAATLGSDSAAISMRQGDGWTVRHVYGMPDNLIGTRMDDKEELHAVLALRSRRPVAVNDAFNDDRFNKEHLRRHDIRAVLVAPLIIYNQPFGVIFFNYHACPHTFTEAEINFISQLAAIASGSLETARLFFELRESEERFRTLATASSEVLYRMNPDWSEMSQLHSRGFLANTEKPSRTWLQEYIHPDDQASVTAAIAEAVRTKRIFEMEHRVRRKDGSLGWTLSRAVPVVNDRGEIVEWFGAAGDITARKETELRLQEENREIILVNRILRVFAQAGDPELFDQVLEIVKEGLGSGHGVFGYISEPKHLICPSLSKMLDACEVADKCIHYPPEKWKGLWARALREKRSFYSNKPSEVPSGHVAIRNNLATPILFRGEAIGLLNLANKESDYTETDRTLLEAMAGRIAPLLYAWIQKKLREDERVKAEEKLRRSEQRLRLALEAAYVISFEWDIQANEVRRFVSADLALTATPEEAPSTFEAVREVVFPDDRERFDANVLTAMERADGRYENEFRVVHPDGGIHWLYERGYVERDAQGRAARLIGLSQDITTRKQTEEALQQLNDTLEQRVAERTELADNRAKQLRALVSELTLTEQRERRRLSEILHDHLQQLLVGAKINCEVLSARIGSEHKEIAENVLSLINQTIQASRSVTAELSPPVLQHGSLSAALKWLVRRMKETHDLTIELQTDSALDPKREDITLLLFQSIRELLLNVVKHAGVKSARVEMARDEHNRLRVAVSDQGFGLERDAVRKKTQSGSGYGLFTIRERLELLGGFLEIDSAPEQGAVFSLIIPLETTEPAYEKSAEKMFAETRKIWPSGDKIRVLLADDHTVVRQGLSTLLNQHADIEVVGEAADGKEAVENALKLHPDVILMDINMPKMDGLEATRIIHCELPHIRIIGLSMYTQADQAAAIIAAGASAYRSKSDNTVLLLAAIRGEIG